MIECEFNVLPRGWHNKEESFILWKPLERNSECMVIQTLNMVFDAKSYQRMPREVTGKIDGKGSIDNLFTKIINADYMTCNKGTSCFF